MREQRRWPRLPWIPITTGLCWLWWTSQAGFWPFFLTLPAGGALLASGVALLLWPGDRRIPQTMAGAAVLGMVLALPTGLALGFGTGLLLLLLCAACFPVAGACAVYHEPHTAGVPVPELDLSLALAVGLDEAILGVEQLAAALPSGEDFHRVRRELHEAHELFDERGWLDKPVSYHRVPPPLEQVDIRSERSGRLAFEHLRFESLYEPHPDEPGRERWLGYGPTRTAHAWLLRHREGNRPWLVCNNGYRMGTPLMDLRVFWRFYHELGLNLAIPVLPLHGPRRIGRQSGDGFLSGETLDTVHAEAQAMWDICRLIGWLRAAGAPRIGTYGLSLGGYTTALLACLEEDLACAIAGVPVTDFSRTFWRHGPKLQLDYLGHVGTNQRDVEQALRVVSPLALEPRVPKSGRMIFGAPADRLVTPDHVRDLIHHWDHPRTVWYSGGHCTFSRDQRVYAGVDATLREAALLA